MKLDITPQEAEAARLAVLRANGEGTPAYRVLMAVAAKIQADQDSNAQRNGQ